MVVDSIEDRLELSEDTGKSLELQQKESVAYHKNMDASMTMMGDQVKVLEEQTTTIASQIELVPKMVECAASSTIYHPEDKVCHAPVSSE